MTFPPPLPPTTSARVFNYLSGGKDHWRADREVAHQVLEVDPGVLHQAAANTAFVRQAVATMAEHGISQILDLGCGLPDVGRHSVHQQLNDAVAGPTLTVYVDHDLQALTHARAYWHAVHGVTVLDADLRDPEAMFADPGLRTVLSMDRPVGVLATLVLQHLEDAHVTALSAALARRLPRGSLLALSHPTGGRAHQAAEAYTRAVADRDGDSRLLARTPEQIEALLVGWKLSGDGLVPAVIPRSTANGASVLSTGLSQLR